MRDTGRGVGRALALGTAGVAWLSIAIVAYAYVHKPFELGYVLGPLRALFQLGLVVALLALAGGVGRLFMKSRGETTMRESVEHAALGLGALSLVVLIVGSLVGLDRGLFGIGALVLAVSFRRPVVQWLKRWPTHLAELRPSGAFQSAAAALSGFILLTKALEALVPPLRFDALSYHLAIPRSYLLAGQIAHLPQNVFVGMPELAESLYTLLMMYGGTAPAVLLGWAMGVLALLVVHDLLREHISARAGYGAVASLLAGETLAGSLSSGYVDWPSVLFSTCMLAQLSDWVLQGRRQSVVLSGVFAGMALSTRYTSGVGLLGGLAMVFGGAKARGVVAILRQATVLGLVAGVTMLPWLVRNWTSTGNPVYPLLLPGGEMDALRLAFYQRPPLAPDWWKTLTLPWQATVWGIEGGVGYYSSMGPLLLGLGPLALLAWTARPEPARALLRTSLTMVLAGLALWAVGSNLAAPLIQTRYYWSALPACAVLAGAGLDSISRLRLPSIRFGRVAGVMVLLSLSFNALRSGLQIVAQNPLALVTGQMTESQFLHSNLGAYAKAVQAVNALPPSANVLMLWEPRGFYCLPRCDSDEIIDRWYHDLHIHGTPTSVLGAWRDAGYTHMLLYAVGAEFVRQDDQEGYAATDWEALERLLDRLPLAESLGGAYALYRLE